MIDGKMQDDATWKQCRVMVDLAEMLARKDPELAEAYELRARHGVALAAASLAVLGAAPARAADDDPNCTATTYGSEPAPARPPLRLGIDSRACRQRRHRPDRPPCRWTRPRTSRRCTRSRRRARRWSCASTACSGRTAKRASSRFQEIVARHDAAGFDSELQVRYHPAEGDEGDIEKWTAYVRHVVDVFGPDPHVVAMTITNEVNLNISENTSDGAYAGAVEALIEGIEAARAEADRIGRPDLPFGFTFAFRWNPGSDAKLWNALGTQGGERVSPRARVRRHRRLPGHVLAAGHRADELARQRAGDRAGDAAALLHAQGRPRRRRADLDHRERLRVGPANGTTPPRPPRWRTWSARPQSRRHLQRHRLPLVQPARQPDRLAGDLRAPPGCCATTTPRSRRSRGSGRSSANTARRRTRRRQRRAAAGER